jgi:trans-2,3-dihydro-3-hydroxyanthranilate isomerase
LKYSMAQPSHDKTIAFFLVDVFAERPLEGNPLPVVPDAARLSETTMRRIAKEFNQSETTFVLPPTREGADHRLRSFTPAGKEASGGAGHHTLGAWWWLAESGALALGDSQVSFTQEGGDHLLPVHITSRSGRPVSVAMSQSAPVFGKVCGDPARLADALNAPLRDLGIDQLPSQVVSTGVAHLLVPLRDRAAVDAARPDFARLGPILEELGGEGCYLFTRDTVRGDSAAYTRFFNPTLGIVEDVATGTAAGPLASQLVARGLVADDSTVEIEQGHTLGRPSVIKVHVAGRAVTISAACIVSGQGSLRVEDY